MAPKKSAAREKAWLEARRSHITSTDLAAIMQIPGAYGSPMDVYLDKKQLLEKGETPKFMEAGLRLQPLILEWYADKLGVAIEHMDPYDLVVCPENPLFAASLDARWHGVGDRRPVDAKNQRYRDPALWGEDGSGDIPPQMVVQLHSQMYCTGSPVADLAALFSGFDHGWFRVERDEEIVAAAIEAGSTFWKDHVLADVPPPVDGSDAWTRFLANRKRKTEVEVITPELRADLEALREARAAVASAAVYEAEVANRVKAAMGDFELIRCDLGRVSFSWGRDGEKTDHEALAAAYAARLLELDPGAKPFLDATMKKHTDKKPGVRSFRPTFKEN